MAAVFIAGIASGLTRDLLQNRNYSNIGVPAHQSYNITILAGVLVFTIVLLGSLYVLQRTISRNLQWLPYVVAIITCICFSPILFFMLVW
jgi:hypothetical protein